MPCGCHSPATYLPADYTTLHSSLCHDSHPSGRTYSHSYLLKKCILAHSHNHTTYPLANLGGLPVCLSLCLFVCVHVDEWRDGMHSYHITHPLAASRSAAHLLREGRRSPTGLTYPHPSPVSQSVCPSVRPSVRVRPCKSHSDYRNARMPSCLVCVVFLSPVGCGVSRCGASSLFMEVRVVKERERGGLANGFLVCQPSVCLSMKSIGRSYARGEGESETEREKERRKAVVVLSSLLWACCRVLMVAGPRRSPVTTSI